MSNKNKTKKVENTFIILTDDFPPSSGGGIATWAYEVHKNLLNRNFNVIVLSRRTKYHRSLGVKNSEHIVYVKGHNWNKFRWFYMGIRLIPFLLREKHPVILSSTWQHIESIWILKKFFNFNILCFGHGTDITKVLYSKQKYKLARVLRQVDFFIPVSSFLEKLTLDNFPTPDFKSFVVHNGVDIEHFKPREDDKKSLRNKFSIPVNNKIIISVGRIIEAKGFRNVINALPIITKQYPSLTYIILGLQKEPEVSKIKSLVKELSLQDHILFLPPVDYEELPQLLNACDIFILISQPVYEPFYQEDNFPMVILEACACELPVIVSNTGGLSEAVIDNTTGYIVPYNATDVLAEKILSLLRNSNQSEKMGRESRKHIINNFSSTITAKKILKITAELA